MPYTINKLITIKQFINKENNLAYNEKFSHFHLFISEVLYHLIIKAALSADIFFIHSCSL